MGLTVVHELCRRQYLQFLIVPQDDLCVVVRRGRDRRCQSATVSIPGAEVCNSFLHRGLFGAGTNFDSP